MNAQELAGLLDGREYNNEMTKAEEAQARADGLVVVFGYSDDNMEFRGAITDEIGCYGGGTAYLTPAGLLTNDCDNDECPHFEKLKESAAKIHAIWGKQSFSWTYQTDIPHATFVVIDDGEKFCRGIVFALSDAGKRQVEP